MIKRMGKLKLFFVLLLVAYLGWFVKDYLIYKKEDQGAAQLWHKLKTRFLDQDLPASKAKPEQSDALDIGSSALEKEAESPK